MKILIIDDDDELRALVAEYLAREGASVEEMCDFSSDAWAEKSKVCDLLILDIGLPTVSGLDVLRRIRQTSSIPVLVLTARGDDIDKILGLELGADDYLPKPFNPHELLARIRAITRRTIQRSQSESQLLRASGIELRPQSRSARVDDSDVHLTTLEFNVLERLLEVAGQVVSKEDLSRDALKRRLMPYDRSVDMHISSLRRKIGENRIKTVRGVGYMVPIDLLTHE